MDQDTAHDSRGDIGGDIRSPLELPSWVEFNRWRWGLGAEFVVERQLGRGAAVRAVFYLDRRGRIVLPHTNAYLPVHFEADDGGERVESAWLAIADGLAQEMRRRHIRGSVILPPEIGDVRPWQWRGFLAGVVYTYIVDMPFDQALATRSARQRAKKALGLGLSCELTDDVDAVRECLRQTERRQGFSYRMSAAQLRKALDLMGSNSLRTYICRDARGQPASSRVVLHAPGTTAIDWLAGTTEDHRTTGATQLLISFVLQDLGSCGAVAFDFAGANLRAVAAAKSHWGGRLTPAYSIQEPGLLGALRLARSWWRFERPAGVL